MIKLLFLSCVALASNALPSARSTCTETLPFASPDCTKYYVCAPYGIQEMSCAPGTVFDPEIYVCNWPRAGLCDSSSSSTTKLTTTEATTTARPELTTKASKELTSESSQKDQNNDSIQNLITEEICAKNINSLYFTAYPNNCSLFITCDYGLGIVDSCPENEYFSAALAACTTDISVCSNEEQTTENLEVTSGNPKEQITEKSKEQTSEQSQAQTTEKSKEDKPESMTAQAICDANRDKLFFAAYPNDCSKFVTCNYGIKIVMSCPPNEYFNAAVSMCSKNASVCSQEEEKNTGKPETVTDNSQTEKNTLTTKSSRDVQSTERTPTTEQSTQKPEEVTSEILTPQEICAANSSSLFLTAYPNNCSLFLTCVYGLAIPVSCPDNEYYSAAQEACTTDSSVCSEITSEKSQEQTTEWSQKQTTEWSHKQTTEWSQKQTTEWSQKQTTEKSQEQTTGKPIIPQEICDANPNKLFFAAYTNDCSKFVACNYGITIIMSCPPNEYFNAALLMCSNNSAVCSQEEEKSTGKPETATDNSQTDKNTATTKSSQEVQSTQRTSTTEQSTQKSEILTPQEICEANPSSLFFAAHPNNCSLFITCYYGRAMVASCPENEYYSADFVACTTDSSVCSEITSEKSQEQTTEMSQEQTTEKSQEQTTGKPIFPQEICEKIPDKLFFAAYPYECSKFITCNYGITIIMSCPPNEYFDATLSICSNNTTVCSQEEGNTKKPETATDNSQTTENTEKSEVTSTTSQEQEAETPEEICEQNSDKLFLAAYPNECTNFILCNYGLTIVGSCPLNEYFDSNLVACTNNASVCSQNTEVTSIAPESSVTKQYTETTEITSEKSQEQTTKNPIMPQEICEALPNKLFFAAYPYDCSKFVACNYGITIMMSCPPNEYFDAVLTICSNNAIVCSQKEKENTEKPETATDNAQTEEHTEKLDITSASTQKAEYTEVSETTSICEQNSDKLFLAAYPNECTKFILCSYGLTVVGSCPPNGYFSSNLGACTNNASVCSQNTEVTSAASQEGQNNTPKEVTSSAPLEDNYTEVSVTTEGSKGEQTTNKPLSPNQICRNNRDEMFFTAIPSDCTKFVTCNYGISILMSCPPNEYFNPFSKICSNDATYCVP